MFLRLPALRVLGADRRRRKGAREVPERGAGRRHVRRPVPGTSGVSARHDPPHVAVAYQGIDVLRRRDAFLLVRLTFLAGGRVGRRGEAIVFFCFLWSPIFWALVGPVRP